MILNGVEGIQCQASMDGNASFTAPAGLHAQCKLTLTCIPYHNMFNLSLCTVTLKSIDLFRIVPHSVYNRKLNKVRPVARRHYNLGQGLSQLKINRPLSLISKTMHGGKVKGPDFVLFLPTMHQI